MATAAREEGLRRRGHGEGTPVPYLQREFAVRRRARQEELNVLAGT